MCKWIDKNSGDDREKSKKEWLALSKSTMSSEKNTLLLAK